MSKRIVSSNKITIKSFVTDTDIAQDLPAQLTLEEEERSLKRKILSSIFENSTHAMMAYTLE